MGRLDRGDDAVGPLVVRVLAPRLAGKAELLERDGEMTELLAAWEGAGAVIVIDAVCAGAAPGTLGRWDALEGPIPTRAGASTHGLGLAEAVELARTLGRLPGRLIVHGIEAQDFTFGAPPSPAVAAGLAALAQRVVDEVEAMLAGR